MRFGADLASVTKPQAVITRSSVDVYVPGELIRDESQNRKRSSQGRVIFCLTFIKTKISSQNRKRSSQGRVKRYSVGRRIYFKVTKPQAVFTRSRIFAVEQSFNRMAMSQNRKRSSQGRGYIDARITTPPKSQNRKRSSQGRGQARKPALQAAEKGIFEKQTNVFLPHK